MRVAEYDIVLEVLVINRTDTTLTNVALELSTMGDLRLVERPPSFTLGPRDSRSLRVSIKVASTETGHIFGTIAYTMFPVLLLRELELGPAAYGLMLTISSIGGIFGAFTAPWWARRFGEGHAIAMTYLYAAAPMFLVVAAFFVPRDIAIVLVAISGFWGVSGIVAFNVVQVSMRQRQSPPRMLARMTASIRTLIWGIGPLGAFLSGVIATHWGLASAFWIGATLQFFGVAFLIFSPLWRLRKVPDPAWMADEEATA